MKPVESTESIDSTKAYIFGQFTLMGTYFGGQAAAIELRSDECYDINRCLVKFHNVRDSIYATEVRPGDYEIDSILYSDGGPGQKISLSAENEDRFKIPKEVIHIKSGQAVYIGSYLGLATSRHLTNSKYHEIKIISSIDDYETASKRLIFFYPEFNGFQLVSAFKNSGK